MARRGYRVCWIHLSQKRRPTCRTLSSRQHHSMKEAAETVLMQNPRARVKVIEPRRGGVLFFKRGRGGRAVVDRKTLF